MRTRIAPMLIIAAALLLPSFETGAKTPKASRASQSSKLIYVNTYRFDPLIGLPDLPAGLRYAPPSPQERIAYIVQFKTSITGSMRQELEGLGIRVLGYIPVDAYLVEANALQVDDARELASVRWAGLLEPAFKLSPNLAVEFDQVINRMSEEIQSPEDRAVGKRPEKVDSTLVLPVRLRVLGRGKAQDVARFLKGNDATEVTEPRHEGGTVGGKVPRGLLHRLAQQAGVIWIERELPVSFANDRAAWVVQSNDIPTKQRTEHLRGLSGLGQTITVGDSGIDWDHDAFVDFLGDGTHEPPGAGHRKVTAYYVPGDAGGDCHENPDPDDPNAPPDTPEPIQHGTHVAGTAAGDDATWGVFDGNGIMESDPIETPGPHDGIAYRAQLQVQDLSRFSIGVHPPSDLHDLFLTAVDPSLRTQDLGEPACLPVTPPAPASFIHTNSWGAFTDPSYTTKSREIDDSMWDNPDLLVLFAAGNRGYFDADYSIGPQASAKNSLTVGASGNGEDANDFATDPISGTRHFSSRGPTCDGRIKPDVMAPGRSLWSAAGCDPPRFGRCEIIGRDCDTSQDCRETCNIDGCEVSGGTCDAQHPCPLLACLPQHDHCGGYRRLTGTSMATPVAAGAAALVREYYMGGYYPGGVLTPSGALVKATLINGAVEMTGAGAYENGETFFPNNQQGWGRINLDQSLKFQGEAQLLEVHDERVGVTDHVTMGYAFNVTPTCGPLEATLVWTDPEPGLEINCNPDVTQLTAPTLVNNLDLVVRSPQGTVYWGNVFSRTASPGLAHSVADPETDPNLQPDARNNVEGVIVLGRLTLGTWNVEVTGTHIGFGDSNPMRQPFALVINCADEDNDDDDDGDPDDLDCAPFDPTIHHGAAELCNGKDEDCDGSVDEGFPDLDGDGIKNCVDCDADGDGVLCNPDCQDLGSCPLDCQDLNPSIPAPEDVTNLPACRDQIDNDCDGLIDLDCAVNPTAYAPFLQTLVSGPLSNIDATSSPNNVYQTLTEGGSKSSKRMKVIYTFPGVNNLEYTVNFEGFKNNTSEVFSIGYANSAACGTTETYTSTPVSVSKVGSDLDTLQTASVGTVTNSSPFLCIKIEDQAGDNQADTVSIDRLFLTPASLTNCADADHDGYTASCSGCFNRYCPVVDCDDADGQESPGLTEGPPGNANCSDGKDNNCNGLADLDDRESCRVAPPDVTTSGQILGTGTVTGSYVLTQVSDDAWQTLKEAKVSNMSRLVHTWIFDNVPAGYAHKLSIEAQKLAAGDDDFLFYYSTDNVTYSPAIPGSTVTQVGSDQVLQPVFGSGALSGRIYIQVRDSNPSNSGSSLDTLKVDRLAIKTVP
jgi:hypothetical protein